MSLTAATEIKPKIKKLNSAETINLTNFGAKTEFRSPSSLHISRLPKVFMFSNILNNKFTKIAYCIKLLLDVSNNYNTLFKSFLDFIKSF